MPYPKEPTKVPAKSGRIAVSFEVLDPADTAISAATIAFTLITATGTVVKERSHPLIPEMSASQKNAIFNFIAQQRAKIDAEAV